MPSRALADSDASLVTLRRRHVVALAAVISLMCAVGVNFGLGWGWMGLLMCSLVWLPYLFILLRIQGRTTKSGLALAVAMGCVMFFPAASLVSIAQEWDRSWWIQGSLALAALTQPVMAAAAIRTYYTLPREPRDRLKLLWSCAYGLVLLFLLASAIPGIVKSPFGLNQVKTGTLLRTINTAVSTYARNFGDIYPSSLAALGPPTPGQKPDCKASGLLDRPPGDRQSGYELEYDAGVRRGKTADGCTGTKHYTLTARPIRFGHTGRLSFFTDDSGVIRATAENRPATVTDPPL